jgi:5-enolpyruvylshikimate-3-phosphate synthase
MLWDQESANVFLIHVEGDIPSSSPFLQAAVATALRTTASDTKIGTGGEA